MPPRRHCQCGNKELEWYEAQKEGKLVAYTIVTFPPESIVKHAPYILAIVKLRNGTRLLGHITGVTPKNLAVGLLVQVVKHKISEDKIVYKFKPLQQ